MMRKKNDLKIEAVFKINNILQYLLKNYNCSEIYILTEFD